MKLHDGSRIDVVILKNHFNVSTTLLFCSFYSGTAGVCGEMQSTLIFPSMINHLQSRNTRLIFLKIQTDKRKRRSA